MQLMHSRTLLLAYLLSPTLAISAQTLTSATVVGKIGRAHV